MIWCICQKRIQGGQDFKLLLQWSESWNTLVYLRRIYEAVCYLTQFLRVIITP